VTDKTSILAGIPKNLRDELIKSYNAIVSNYVEHRWEPSELNGGKFCEVIYTILSGTLAGPMPTKASKPRNMVAACKALESQKPSSPLQGDHSLRILIPRILPALYDVRNNRGVGHVGGDVDPNYMDATVVYEIASWILAELVRIFYSTTTEQAQKIVDSLVERKSTLIWEIGSKRLILDPSMPIKDQTLVHLHSGLSWVSVKELLEWVEYSNASVYRAKIIRPLHKARLIEYDKDKDQAHLSPLGVSDVETRILKKYS